MFSTKTYQNRRKTLKNRLKSGLLIFPGNKEVGMNYAANWYPFPAGQYIFILFWH